jgi:hypothetical protein
MEEKSTRQRLFLYASMGRQANGLGMWCLGRDGAVTLSMAWRWLVTVEKRLQ